MTIDKSRDSLEIIKIDGILFAIIIRNYYKSEGVRFFTSPADTLQLGYMNRDKGYHIKPHIHKSQQRTVHYTNEVLFIRSGLVKVSFYDVEKIYKGSRKLGAGDVILLAGGGHGFEFIEDSEIVEVKQGPYFEGNDKMRFDC